MADQPTPDTEPDPPLTEVEITVAGHTIVVKAAAPMEDVAAQALGLFRDTALTARSIPLGFDASGSQAERALQPDYSGQLERWGAEEADARLGRQHPQGSAAPGLAGAPD